jgi:hypothetical protein
MQPESFTDVTNPLAVISFIDSHPTLRADDLVPASDIGRLISVSPAHKPYSSAYWPYFKNGILARWQGSSVPSPAEKYGALFLSAAEQTELYDWIRDNHGQGVPNAPEWYGICQGWAGATIAEQAPAHSITVHRVPRGNGTAGIEKCTGGTGCVTFTPGDLTGLVAEAYADADFRLVGERCDMTRGSFHFDAAGRVVETNCRANAGTLFLVATNLIKLADHAFVVNAANNDQIWNQPAFAYQINSYTPLSAQQAAQRIEPGATSYLWNPNAVGFRQVSMTLSLADNARPTVSTPPPLVPDRNVYQFILELDARGVVLGGEWLGKSKTDHPPFIWVPVTQGTQAPHLSYSDVKALLDLSVM